MSTLRVGTHLIALEVRDGNGTLARAATTVSIGYTGGVPCADSSVCLSGYCTGGTCCAPGVCGKVQVTNGEVFLKGTYIEMGLHSAGGFGTVGEAPVSFNGVLSAKNSWGKGVGISVDYNRDGFNAGAPTAFSGDYFLPGSPVEGWVVSYKTTSTGAAVVLVNKGRMGKVDVPQVFVEALSSSGVTLAAWVGRSGPLEIRRAVYFEESDMTIYMHTTIVNTGSAKLFDVRYLRSIDPDQEQPWLAITDRFSTNNYVKYQYTETVSSTSYLVLQRRCLWCWRLCLWSFLRSCSMESCWDHTVRCTSPIPVNGVFDFLVFFVFPALQAVSKTGHTRHSLLVAW